MTHDNIQYEPYRICRHYVPVGVQGVVTLPDLGCEEPDQPPICGSAAMLFPEQGWTYDFTDACSAIAYRESGSEAPFTEDDNRRSKLSL